MTTPLLLIFAIIAIGLLFVVFPVALDTFYRYRKRKIITCPETHGSAEVQLDTRRALFTSAFGKPLLAIKHCSLWPKKKGCDEACVKENWPEPH